MSNFRLSQWGKSCFIGIKGVDGSMQGVICLFYGTPEYTGAILVAKYRSADRVRKLISLGTLRHLGEKLEPNPSFKHDDVYPQENVTVAVHRDCGCEGPRIIRSNVEGIDYEKFNIRDFIFIFDEKKQKWSTLKMQNFSFNPMQPPVLVPFPFGPVHYAEKVRNLVKYGDLTRVGEKTLEEIEKLYK